VPPAGSSRGLVVASVAALALGLLSLAPADPPRHTIQIDAVPAASTSWLDRLNEWRISTGLPTLTENTTWSQGDHDHAVYMVKNDLVTHYETPGTPYYTTDGDTAAQDSNIQVSSTTATTDADAIDWWMGAPFHALGMMDPRLTTSGFGSYREVKSGWDEGAAVDVLRGNSFAGGSYPVYFPGNGTTEPLTSYSGYESPDPLSACSGYAMPVGLPVFVQVGGNVATTVGAHSLTANGTALANCVIDSNNTTLGAGLKERGAVVLVPRQPLQSDVTYTVNLTVNGTAYSWTFKVGPFFTVAHVSPKAGATAGGTTVTITGSGFSNGLTSVMFGTTAATSFNVVSDTTVTAVAPAHALGAVDVTVTTAAGTSAISAADVFTYATPCTAVTASASPPGPSVSGTQVTITGAATCPSPNALYEYWMLAAGATTWRLVQPYSTSSTYLWNSTGARSGTETFGVWVRDATSPGTNASGTGDYDTYVSLAYTIGSSPRCSSVTLTFSPASPATAGTQVTLSALASGCPNPRYEFWMLAAGTTTWRIVQGYTATATYKWNSTGALSGTEQFGVWARDAGSGAAYDTYTSTPYAVTASCGSAIATATPASVTHGTGAHVTITASATGCSTSPRYEFWMRAASQSSWIVVQGYSTSATYDWNSTGAAVGTVYFGVWVRDASSAAAYDKTTSVAVTVT
jgi:IPT/TIG domain/Cysteine-rich secretory protein family